MEMLQNWLYPQLNDQEPADFIFQQDGASPRCFLTTYAGRSRNQGLLFHHWPPRFPDITPSDLFLWGYVKGLVFQPTMPTTLDAMKITAAIQSVDMLERGI
ncbi:hypothetical protein J437_LFUL004828 [Ladona fulva]|uniref:Uncharacterized protein n=1 Tax=Ladona fulva TaxID=123851 RepID=A0A8K0K1S2_LADFU|nr:hypothetical protein J437_LFUL004828 [Ladona fulva]